MTGESLPNLPPLTAHHWSVSFTQKHLNIQSGSFSSSWKKILGNIVFLQYLKMEDGISPGSTGFLSISSENFIQSCPPISFQCYTRAFVGIGSSLIISILNTQHAYMYSISNNIGPRPSPPNLGTFITESSGKIISRLVVFSIW